MFEPSVNPSQSRHCSAISIRRWSPEHRREPRFLVNLRAVDANRYVSGEQVPWHVKSRTAKIC